MFRNTASPITKVDSSINPENRGRRILRNISKILPDYFGITSQNTAIITLAVVIKLQIF